MSEFVLTEADASADWWGLPRPDHPIAPEAQPKSGVVLTEADALADLAGLPRPDHPSAEGAHA